MKVFDLREGNLYINKFNSHLMLFLGSVTDHFGDVRWYRFLIDKEIVEFEWSKFQTISLEMVE